MALASPRTESAGVAEAVSAVQAALGEEGMLGGVSVAAAFTTITRVVDWSGHTAAKPPRRVKFIVAAIKSTMFMSVLAVGVVAITAVRRRM
jgi:hypothetical protein